MTARIETLSFHGQPALQLSTAAGARAVVMETGAQVVSWSAPDGRERLYLSPQAVFDGHMPVRGGIPVSFPQFATLGALPRHGFVRTLRWIEVGRRSGEDFALVVLRGSDDEHTRRLWPHRFALELCVAIEDSRLDLELEVINEDEHSFEFTTALHTYLRTAEVEHARLEGLYGLEYRDAADGDRLKRDSGDCLVIEGETDRVYHDLNRPLLLRTDTGSLGLNQEGFPDTVVWNPWEDRCAALADMPDRDFRHMLCIEAAAVRTPVSLEPGASWWGRQTLLAL